jgi:DNA-binding LacI/PurR family transcriptional regulator
MSKTIGIVSTVQDMKFFTQGYFRTVLSAAGKQTVGRDVTLRLISLTDSEFENSEATKSLLAAQHCNAIIVVAPKEIFLPTITEICRQMPGIIISPPNLEISVSYVASDNYGAARAIIAHLASRGRHRLAIFQPYPLSGDFWERERGYRDSAHSLGVDLMVHPIHYPLTDEQIAAALSDKPDGLVAPSDNDALPMLAYLSQIGMRVPQDVAVVGFDDEDFAATSSPPLTTVRQPIADLASSATAYLVERLVSHAQDIQQEILPNTLVVRAST